MPCVYCINTIGREMSASFLIVWNGRSLRQRRLPYCSRSISTFNIAQFLKKLFQIPRFPSRQARPCKYFLKKPDIIFLSCISEQSHVAQTTVDMLRSSGNLCVGDAFVSVLSWALGAEQRITDNLYSMRKIKRRKIGRRRNIYRDGTNI